MAPLKDLLNTSNEKENTLIQIIDPTFGFQAIDVCTEGKQN